MSNKNGLFWAVCPGCISEDGDCSSGQLGKILDHHYPVWSCSSIWIPFLKYEAQKWTQWFRFKLRSAEQLLLLAWWQHIDNAALYVLDLSCKDKMTLKDWLTLKGFSSSLSANLFSNQSVPLHKLVLTHMETPQLLLLNSLTFLMSDVVPFSSRNSWMWSCSPKYWLLPPVWFHSPACWECTLSHHPGCLIKAINSVYPSMDPWGKLLVSGCP